MITGLDKTNILNYNILQRGDIMPTVRDQDAVLTTGQAAALLKTSRQTISVMVKAGILPAARVGNRFRFSRRVILEYVRTGTPGMPGRKATQEPGPGAGQ